MIVGGYKRPNRSAYGSVILESVPLFTHFINSVWSF